MMNRVDYKAGTWYCPDCSRTFRLLDGEIIGVYYHDCRGGYYICQTCHNGRS